MKAKGFNRHVMSKGRPKRPHKGISNMPKECITNLSKRLIFESKQLEKYLKRVNQL